ncbi:GDP-mannose 4,6-dehydratase, partial [Aquiluna sp.]|nr:GDP-mannose 4,6-dehydratase [Aquiluna sp.]
ELDEHYLRPTEVDSLIGDPSKASATLGWTAKTDAKKLCEIMCAHEVKLLEDPTAIDFPSWNL